MAATDLSRRAPPAPAGALPQTPALLRDGGNPNGESGRGRGISSPGGYRCHRTPGQVKGAFGVAGEGASAPLAPSGEPAAPTRAGPTRRCPTPQATARRARRRMNTHHHDEQMFDKTRQKNYLPG